MNKLTSDHVTLAWLHNGERPVTLEQVAHAAVLNARLRTGAANEEMHAVATRRHAGDIARGLSGSTFPYVPPRRIQLDTLPPMDRERFAEALAALAEQGEISLVPRDDEIWYEPSPAERALYAT